MRGLIILDGPDGTGKTTLAQHFVDKYDAVYIHATYRFAKNIANYLLALLLKAIHLVNLGKLVVIDRLWMSEHAYANAFRGGNVQIHSRLFDRIVLRYSGLYVLCLPEDKGKYLEHFKQLKGLREEMYSSMDIVYDEYGKIRHRMKEEKWPHYIRYDFMKNDVWEFGNKLFCILNNFQKWTYPQGFIQGGFLGCPGLADYLFIDSEPSTRKGLPWLPRISPTPGNLFLLDQLNKYRIPEYLCMWIDSTQYVIAKQLLETYDLRPICFGIEAYQELVRDAESAKKYNRPRVFISPERHLALKKQTTFEGCFETLFFGDDE